MSKYKKWRYTIQYVKPTAQMVFKIDVKGGPTYRRQVVDSKKIGPPMKFRYVISIKLLCSYFRRGH